MTDNIAYTTTTKGKAEIAAKPGALKPGTKGLLAAVGRRASVTELRARFPRAGDIGGALALLVKDGYLELLPEKASVPPPTVRELENFLSERPKEPTLEQLRQAESTISGARRLKAGYQISILNRPGKPVAPRGDDKHVVLVIDSHEAEALVAARALMQNGFDVRGAGTRSEIAAALGRTPLPDLIIMDVDLRDTVGLDVLGKIREHAEFKDTPILVVTARAERDDIVAALAYGASGYLNKPIAPKALVRNTRDALGLD
ncbi:MAG: response regulator [Burkholderiales bacterium]|nr:response regulator [Burkholderiales bacterium]MDP2397663.1 response regulator [Burkholderiales bacterium]